MNRNETGTGQAGRIKFSERTFLRLIFSVQVLWLITIALVAVYLTLRAMKVN